MGLVDSNFSAITFAFPRYEERFLALTEAVFISPSAILFADFLMSEAISLSRFLTPASRVYSFIILRRASSLILKYFFAIPFLILYLGDSNLYCRLLMCAFWYLLSIL